MIQLDIAWCRELSSQEKMNYLQNENFTVILVSHRIIEKNPSLSRYVEHNNMIPVVFGYKQEVTHLRPGPLPVY